MSVGGNDSDGRRPLVVLLVELLVEAGMVEQPVRRRRGGNKTALALHFFHSQTLINHGFKENQSLDNLPFPFSSKKKMLLLGLKREAKSYYKIIRVDPYLCE